MLGGGVLVWVAVLVTVGVGVGVEESTMVNVKVGVKVSGGTLSGTTLALSGKLSAGSHIQPVMA